MYVEIKIMFKETSKNEKLNFELKKESVLLKNPVFEN